MKDLIAKLQMDAYCALGAIWLHIDAQVARIAELETKLQEQDAMLGRRPCQDDRCVKMAELEAQIAAASAPDDTDKLREAIAGISNNAITDAWESCGGVGGFYKSFGYQQFAHAVLDLAADAVSSMALQAPVREVPGYKLVPLEITDAMLEAWKHELCIPIGSSPEAKARRAYKAMLAAAPLPAAPVQQEPKP